MEMTSPFAWSDRSSFFLCVYQMTSSNSNADSRVNSYGEDVNNKARNS